MSIERRCTLLHWMCPNNNTNSRLDKHSRRILEYIKVFFLHLCVTKRFDRTIIKGNTDCRFDDPRIFLETEHHGAN